MPESLSATAVMRGGHARTLIGGLAYSLRLAIAGNPNCGKTTVFNALTGAHQHVGNYSGVTVDAKRGRCTPIAQAKPANRPPSTVFRLNCGKPASPPIAPSR